MTDKILNNSRKFWNGMLKQDGEAMYSVADPKCMFVHIGTNANLDKEVKYYSVSSGTEYNTTNYLELS